MKLFGRSLTFKKLLQICLFIIVGYIAYEYFSLPSASITSLNTDNPEATSMMKQRVLESNGSLGIRHTWVPLNKISRNFINAVLTAEDRGFFSHPGIEWNALERAYKRNQKAGKVRLGGSTITMQLAKNLYLSSERSVVRKIKEAIIALRLEGMQERQVTIGEHSYKLPEPFLVMATQNPIEQEGTYPLPEAQVDRFMLKVKIDYPSRDEELLIMRQNVANTQPTANPVISPDDIIRARQVFHEVYVDEKIERYILDIVSATRRPKDFGLDNLANLISYGGSPRASIYLALAGKAYAFIKRRGYVIPEDIRAICFDVLRHRVAVTYEAEAEEITSENIVQEILNKIEVP